MAESEAEAFFVVRISLVFYLLILFNFVMKKHTLWNIVSKKESKYSSEKCISLNNKRRVKWMFYIIELYFHEAIELSHHIWTDATICMSKAEIQKLVETESSSTNIIWCRFFLKQKT